MARVFVSHKLPGTALERSTEAHDTTIWPEHVPPRYEELRRQARDSRRTADAGERPDRRGADRAAPNLKVISNYGVGYDNIDVAAAAAHGIPVGNTPDVLTEATADLAWALLMTAARRIPEAQSWAAPGEWKHLGPDGIRRRRRPRRHPRGDRLRPDRTGGRAASRGVRDDRALGRAPRWQGDRKALDRLLRESDFVSLHCPLTPQTRHLIDGEALTKMKPTAILINTARGAIVDQLALVDALATGQIGGAALDVTDPEPLPPDNALWQAPNLVIVPHIGSATTSTRAKMAEIATDNLLAGLAGRAAPPSGPAPPRPLPPPD